MAEGWRESPGKELDSDSKSPSPLLPTLDTVLLELYCWKVGEIQLSIGAMEKDDPGPPKLAIWLSKQSLTIPFKFVEPQTSVRGPG